MIPPRTSMFPYKLLLTYLLFVTGPSYYLSMATAFGIDPVNLKSKLTKELEIVDVTSELKSDIPAFWTYHTCNSLGINCADVFQKQSVVKNTITNTTQTVGTYSNILMLYR